MDKRYLLTLAAKNMTGSAFKQVKSDVAAAAGEYGALEQKKKRVDQLHRDVGALRKGSAELKKLKVDLAAAKLETESLARAGGASKTATRKLSREFEVSRKRVKKLQSEVAEMSATTHTLEKNLKSSGIGTSDLATRQERLAKAAAGTNKRLREQQKSLAEVEAVRGKAFAMRNKGSEQFGRAGEEARNAAVLAAVVALPVWRAEAAGTAMAGVSKVVDFEGDEKLKFQQALYKKTAAAGMSFSDGAAIAEAAGQSNIAKDEIIDFTMTAGKMGVAFDMAAADAGETMAAWRAGMSLNQSQAEQLADAVNHVSNNMNAKAGDIADVLKRQGAVAMTSGYTETQTASLAGALLSGGASKEIAATALKNLTGSLTKGEAATGREIEGFGALGFDPVDLASRMQQDAVGTTMEVFDALRSMPMEQQSALITQLFGEESKGAIAPLLKNMENLRASFALTADKTVYLGAMDIEYQGVIDTAAHKRGVAAQELDRLAAALGGALLPATSAVSESVAAAARNLTEFVQENEGVASTLALVVGGLVAWKTAQVASLLVRGTLNKARANANLMTTRSATSADRLTASLGRMSAQMNRSAAMAGAGGGRGRRGRGGVDVAAGGRKPGRHGFMQGMKGKKLPGVAGAAMGAMAVGSMLYSGKEDGQTNASYGADLAGAAGGMLGMAKGAAMGATLGSLVPGVGTVIGGLVGGGIGYLGGDWIGSAVGNLVGGMFDDESPVTKAIEESDNRAQQQVPAIKSDAVIHVHPSEGMDEEALAQKVADAQKELYGQFAGYSVETALQMNYSE